MDTMLIGLNVAKLSEEQRLRRALARARAQALEAEEDDRRREARSQQWADENMRLTWAEYEAGVPCRGCGQPILDGRGGWPGLMYLNAAEKLEYEQAEQAFKQKHSDCRGGRWSVAGSRQTHCSWCCPPPPISEQRLAKLAELLTSIAARKDPRDLNLWRLQLICDHEVERTQHRSYDTWTGLRVTPCTNCGVNRGVVQAIQIGPVSHPDTGPSTELAADIAAASQKLARQEAAAAKSRRRLEELKSRQ